jgi:HEAT repeat protein
MENRRLLRRVLGLILICSFVSLGYGAEKIELLLKELKNPDPNIRAEAALSIGLMKDRNAVDSLIKTLSEEKDIRVEKALVEALGSIGDVIAFDPLVKTYYSDGEKDWTLRATIINSLGKLNDKRVVPELINMSKRDSFNVVREKAIKKLGELKDSISVQYLIARVSISDTSTENDMTIWALGEIGDKRAIPILIKTLNTPFIKESAALALGKIGDKSAIPALEEALKNNPKHIAFKMALKMLTGKDY